MYKYRITGLTNRHLYNVLSPLLLEVMKEKGIISNFTNNNTVEEMYNDSSTPLNINLNRQDIKIENLVVDGVMFTVDLNEDRFHLYYNGDEVIENSIVVEIIEKIKETKVFTEIALEFGVELDDESLTPIKALIDDFEFYDNKTMNIGVSKVFKLQNVHFNYINSVRLTNEKLYKYSEINNVGNATGDINDFITNLDVITKKLGVMKNV